VVSDQNIMGLPHHLVRAIPSHRLATSVVNRPPRTMKNTDDVRGQGNGCEDRRCAPGTGFSDSATNGRWYGDQVGTSGPLYAKNIHSAVKPILPAESPTDTSVLALYRQEAVKKSPDSHDNKNEGLGPDQDRHHLSLHGLLYVNNGHDATRHIIHSAGNALDDTHLHDA